MTDLSKPPFPLSELPPAADEGAPAAKPRHAGFRWPTPPFAGYPQASEQARPEPCVIAGMNGKIVHGRMTHFLPDEQLVNVQTPPSRTTLPLQFNQFRTLALLLTLDPLARPAGDPHAAVLSHARAAATAWSSRPASCSKATPSATSRRTSASSSFRRTTAMPTAAA